MTRAFFNMEVNSKNKRNNKQNFPHSFWWTFSSLALDKIDYAKPKEALNIQIKYGKKFQLTSNNDE